MKLRDVDILPAYSTEDGKDLLDSFYNPVLECAVKYDRVTGFFLLRFLRLQHGALENVLKIIAKLE